MPYEGCVGHILLTPRIIDPRRDSRFILIGSLQIGPSPVAPIGIGGKVHGQIERVTPELKRGHNLVNFHGIISVTNL